MKLKSGLMGKTKNPGKTFELKYKKTKSICLADLASNYKPESEDDIKNEYNPFHIDKIQMYNPLYELFFQLNATNYNSITLNHEYYINGPNILNTNTDEKVDKTMYIKFSPLIDPLRFLVGKYDKKYDITVLPQIDNSLNTIPLLQSYNNISYIDTFFCFLSSMLKTHNNFIHGLEYYGSYLGIQNKFKVLISDDVDYLYSSPYFVDLLGKNVAISSWVENIFQSGDRIYGNTGSRNCRQKIVINEEIEIEEIEVLPIENVDKVDAKVEPTIESVDLGLDSSQDSDRDSSQDSDRDSSQDSDRDSNQDSDRDSSQDSEYETMSDDSTCTDLSAEENKAYAYINNYPIQLICQEKCEGTLYSLFKEEVITDEDMGLALMMQIIMSLITYQKAFHLTHNDLHSKNVMYKYTEKTHIVYKYEGEYYSVPTYGYILHIIDFGRSIYKYKGHQICSDSFIQGGDAYGQYNFGHFYNDNKPRIDPNYSFDLCRIACCLQEFLFSPECNPKTLDSFQSIIYRWCQDDSGKNIMYKTNGDERYPGFELYRMIALKVHRHIPSMQLKQPCFRKFRVEKKIKQADPLFFDLDSIPDYSEETS